MRGKTARDTAKIRCPFFRTHNNQSIGCEGIYEGCSLQINFAGLRGREWHEQVYCCGRFEACELYRAIMEQYIE